MKIQEVELGSFLENNKIKLPNDCELEKVIKVNEYFWLILDFPNYHKEQDTNVWCFDESGELIWKIERLDFPKDAICPFMHIYEENGQIYADNWNGVHVHINPETGEIIAQKNQRPW